MSSSDSSPFAVPSTSSILAPPGIWQYIESMYIESPDKVKIVIDGDRPGSDFTFYLSAAAVQETSTILGTEELHANKRPYTIHFDHDETYGIAIFGLWLGLHNSSDAEVREGFEDVIQWKFEELSGYLVKAWQVAQRLGSQPFKNYLTTIAVEMADDDLEVIIGEANRFASHGYAGCSLVGAMIENLAFLIVKHELDPSVYLHDWMQHAALMSASPPLLIDLLATIEELKGLQFRGWPYHPIDRLCWKWHMHKSMAERRACPNFTEDEGLLLDASDDEEEPKVCSTEGHQQSIPEEYHEGWAQQRMEGREGSRG